MYTNFIMKQQSEVLPHGILKNGVRYYYKKIIPDFEIFNFRLAVTEHFLNIYQLI